MFVFGQLLLGVGATALVTLGTTFLDDSVRKTLSPLYISIFQTWFVIGPAIGYVVGGELLKVYLKITILF